MKKILIRLVETAIMEILISEAKKRLDNVNDARSKAQWLTVIEFLQEVKQTGLPL